jgi:hypothetical protein
MEEAIYDNSPSDPPKAQKKSRELDGLETSLGGECTPPAEGGRRNRGGKNTSPVSAQLTLDDEELEDMIPIYAAAAISNYHEDAIDPNS